MDRISAVCSLIRPCDCLADIGCDHGLVAKYALDNGVKEVIAADISEGSLKKAKKLLGGYPNVTYRLSDGFDRLRKRRTSRLFPAWADKRLSAYFRVLHISPS